MMKKEGKFKEKLFRKLNEIKEEVRKEVLSYVYNLTERVFERVKEQFENLLKGFDSEFESNQNYFNSETVLNSKKWDFQSMLEKLTISTPENGGSTSADPLPDRNSIFSETVEHLVNFSESKSTEEKMLNASFLKKIKSINKVIMFDQDLSEEII